MCVCACVRVRVRVIMCDLQTSQRCGLGLDPILDVALPGEGKQC